jgi:putative membrane protein
MRTTRMRNRIVLAFLTLTAALLALPAWAQTPENPPEWRYWHHHGDFGWGHMLFGSLMMVLFWGGLILLIVLAVRYLGHGSARGGERSSGGKTPLQILEERFARGEIDKAEFEERKQALYG